MYVLLSRCTTDVHTLPWIAAMLFLFIAVLSSPEVYGCVWWWWNVMVGKWALVAVFLWTPVCFCVSTFLLLGWWRHGGVIWHLWLLHCELLRDSTHEHTWGLYTQAYMGTLYTSIHGDSIHKHTWGLYTRAYMGTLYISIYTRAYMGTLYTSIHGDSIHKYVEIEYALLLAEFAFLNSTNVQPMLVSEVLSWSFCQFLFICVTPSPPPRTPLFSFILAH
jgi:hypothetical protein